MRTAFQTTYRMHRPSRQKNKSPESKILEKTYTRQPHISNFMQGLNVLPEISKGRPLVKNVKKRESLLLKGQSDELNASFGSDYTSVFVKANEKITGKLSVISSNRSRQDSSALVSPTSRNLKL